MQVDLKIQKEESKREYSSWLLRKEEERKLKSKDENVSISAYYNIRNLDLSIDSSSRPKSALKPRFSAQNQIMRHATPVPSVQVQSAKKRKSQAHLKYGTPKPPFDNL